MTERGELSDDKMRNQFVSFECNICKNLERKPCFRFYIIARLATRTIIAKTNKWTVLCKNRIRLLLHKCVIVISLRELFFS